MASFYQPYNFYGSEMALPSGWLLVAAVGEKVVSLDGGGEEDPSKNFSHRANLPFPFKKNKSDADGGEDYYRAVQEEQ